MNRRICTRRRSL